MTSNYDPSANVFYPQAKKSSDPYSSQNISSIQLLKGKFDSMKKKFKRNNKEDQRKNNIKERQFTQDKREKLERKTQT